MQLIWDFVEGCQCCESTLMSTEVGREVPTAFSGHTDRGN